MKDQGPEMPSSESEHRHDRRQARVAAWGWWFFAAVALFYLLTEHRAHLFGVLPLLLVLACPLVHLFMHHGGHGGHGRHGGHGAHDGPRHRDPTPRREDEQ